MVLLFLDLSLDGHRSSYFVVTIEDISNVQPGDVDPGHRHLATIRVSGEAEGFRIVSGQDLLFDDPLAEIPDVRDFLRRKTFGPELALVGGKVRLRVRDFSIVEALETDENGPSRASCQLLVDDRAYESFVMPIIQLEVEAAEFSDHRPSTRSCFWRCFMAARQTFLSAMDSSVNLPLGFDLVIDNSFCEDSECV